MSRRRLLVPLLVALGVAIWLVFGSKIPKAQTVHVVLGDAAPRVEEVRVKYAPLATPEAWDREVELRFAAGTAPRVATHTFRAADGDYHVEIEVVSRDESGSADNPETRVRVDRKIRLEGGSVSIDVSQAR
jgi:hypothetical protein